MSLEDQPQSGRPSTSRTDENIKKIRDVIMFDHHQTIDELDALTWGFVELMSTNFNRRTSHENELLRNSFLACSRSALSVRQFLTKNGMTTASHPPTPRTWHPAIFSCFQEWRGTLKESVFRMWRRWGKKRQRHWRLSLCKSSRTVLNNGKSGGITVLIVRGSILRVIKLWKCTEKYTI